MHKLNQASLSYSTNHTLQGLVVVNSTELQRVAFILRPQVYAYAGQFLMHVPHVLQFPNVAWTAFGFWWCLVTVHNCVCSFID
jgi:hypothetical protein